MWSSRFGSISRDAMNHVGFWRCVDKIESLPEHVDFLEIQWDVLATWKYKGLPKFYGQLIMTFGWGLVILKEKRIRIVSLHG